MSKRKNNLKTNKAKDLVQVQNKVQDFIDFEPLRPSVVIPFEDEFDQEEGH